MVPRIWGTRNLAPWFPNAALTEPIGEVWLSGDACTAHSGPLQGQSLQAICSAQAEAMLGGGNDGHGSPLLIKILFAQEKLSVQVHPDDALARRQGQPRGKTECWYALEAAPGAEVACGLKPGVNLAAIEASLQDHTLEGLLNVLPVAAGEMIFVDAGTVHAIWPGAVLLETQQNSDVTYRLYDYGRPRALHIRESLEALKLTTGAGKVTVQAREDREILVDCAYFRIERIRVLGRMTGQSLAGAETGASLSYLFCQSGRMTAMGQDGRAIPWPEHTALAVPAQTSPFQLESTDGATVLRIVAKTPAHGA